MIGFLRGRIISKKPTEVLIDVAGVGYLVNISLNTYEQLGDNGSEAELFTHLHVKENEFSLYGFPDETEKNIFLMLIGVSGIGPKLAISVLSGIRAADLISAIENGDAARLKSVQGIGKKTAERLILELKDKLGGIVTESASEIGGAYAIKKDAVAALVSLGFNIKKAETFVNQIMNENPDAKLEEVIKEALKRNA
jgi:Holliday junction DNA helicase RuvA